MFLFISIEELYSNNGSLHFPLCFFSKHILQCIWFLFSLQKKFLVTSKNPLHPSYLHALFSGCNNTLLYLSSFTSLLYFSNIPFPSLDVAKLFKIYFIISLLIGS